MGGVHPLCCLTLDMMLTGFHLSKDPVPSGHVTYCITELYESIGNINLKHYKFLSIKALHVTFSAVAACLIRLVCFINMDAEESFADCECQMSIRS